MRPGDDMNGARARASRIRTAHDMEATMLDAMHRRTGRSERRERRSLLRALVRLLRPRPGVARPSDAVPAVQIESQAGGVRVSTGPARDSIEQIGSRLRDISPMISASSMTKTELVRFPATCSGRLVTGVEEVEQGTVRHTPGAEPPGAAAATAELSMRARLTGVRGRSAGSFASARSTTCPTSTGTSERHAAGRSGVTSR